MIRQPGDPLGHEELGRFVVGEKLFCLQAAL